MKIADMRNNVFYFLERGAQNINDPEARVVEMKIIDRNNQSYAYAKQGYFTLEFEVSDEMFELDGASERPSFFTSRYKAEGQYRKELIPMTEAIRDMSKEELFLKFFQLWSHDSSISVEVYDQMVEKIKTEFGVNVLKTS